jgi:hypothetical protein
MNLSATAVVASLMLAAAAQPARATGDLSGRVLFSDLPVPGATVTATRSDRTVATVSDDEGAFRFADLDDGVWTVRVEMRGFVSASRDVTLPSAGQPLTITLTMRSFDDIVGRRALQTTSTPAHPPATVAPADAPPPDDPGVRVINGSVVNGAATVFAQPRAFGNNRPGQRVLYTGAVTSLIGNSAWNARPFSFAGSTAPHPSYGDVQLGFTLGGPLKIPSLLKHGPETVIHYQHGVTHNATAQSALLPTLAERHGDFSRMSTPIRDPQTGLPFAGNVIPSNRISSQGTALLAYYPLPDGEAHRGANHQTPIVTKTAQHTLQLGMNRNLRRTTLGGTIAYQRTATESQSIFDFADTRRQSSLNAAATATHRFSTRLLLRVSYQFARAATNVTPFFANRVNVSGEAGIAGNNQDPANWGPPALLFPDMADLRDADYERTIRKTHTGGAEASIRHRGHEIKVGGDVRWSSVDVSSHPNPRGTLTFTGAATGNALADFLLGVPTTSAIAFGDAPVRLRGDIFDAYVTDDFRVRAGLTLNLGVRWEYERPFTERSGRLVNLDVAPGFTAIGPVLATSPIGALTRASYPPSLLRSDARGFQPRLAVSWRPIAASSFIVRGSYGLYRNLGLYQPLALLLAQQPPFSRNVSVENTALTPLTLANPFPASLPNANTFAVDPDFRAAYAHTWQASAQRDLPASLTVIAAYFGDRGTHLTQAFLPNTFPAGAVNPCPTCPSGFVYVASNGTSRRHAAQFTIRRRLHAGFTATMQYTLATSTDDAATFSNTAVRPASLAIAQDWLNLDAERGPSSFDQRHLTSVQVQYTTGVGVSGGTLVDSAWGTLFKDWTVAGQLSAGSGLPLTPVSFTAIAGTGIVGVRPALTGVSIEPTAAGSYANPAAFAAPLPGSWGNAGRNSIRGPAPFSLDASLARVFRLRGRLNLEWRVAATNVLNRVTFAAINTVITSPQFGLPTIANPMRRVQSTFRLRF